MVHDDNLVVSVELVGHLLAKGLDGCLDEGLLCVHIKLAISFVGSLSEVSHSAIVEIEVLEILIGQIAQFSRNFLLKCCSVLIDGEQVAIGVPLDV